MAHHALLAMQLELSTGSGIQKPQAGEPAELTNCLTPCGLGVADQHTTVCQRGQWVDLQHGAVALDEDLSEHQWYISSMSLLQKDPAALSRA